MSTDSKEPPDGKDPPDDDKDKKKESDFDRELKKGPLSPSNEELFNFLDNLFTGEGEFPERIDVRIVKGRNRDQYGRQVKQFIFKSGSVKPSRERVVMMTNDIVLRIRQETDVMRRETDFMIGAMHSARSDDFYEIMTLTVKPTKKWSKSGAELGIIGDDNNDDDSVPFSLSYEKAFLSHSNTQSSLMWSMIEGLVDRMERHNSLIFNQLEKVQIQNFGLIESHLHLLQAADDREEKRERSKMWRENISKAVDHAWKLVPPVMASLKGNTDSWSEGTESPESMTLSEFFREKSSGGRLTEQEFEKIFGTTDKLSKMIVTAGILSEEQGYLLMGVAQKKVNPNALDALLPGGQCEITPVQSQDIIAAGIPVDVLMPLKLLLDVRVAKKQRKEKENGSP